MKKILKSYLFWTFPRGSFHYDVMVTLILIFIFGSPFVINYRERPQQAPAAAQDVLVREDGANAFVYEISAGQLAPAASAGTMEKEADLRAELLARIQAISGPVELDRYAAERDASGRVTGYRVWAHR
ncbi:MAG TPA: hypothetical protein VHX11_06755 [Acidobacteriaceae bacterium]|jgi:hypothetical protein|nr:hypothetical protein [Acidobacteriaceae bacterium]